ncbi:MAG: hypothetical protein IJM94_06845, partial [Clostridia bacterium]|nr:hypothetical protein [Clostridia bacterium]
DNDIIALYKLKDRADKEFNSTKHRYPLADEDENIKNSLLTGVITVNEIPSGAYKEAILKVYEAEKALRDVERKLARHNAIARGKFSDIADSLLEGSDNWKEIKTNEKKDKQNKENKGILRFSLQTAERVIRSIIPDEAEANNFISKVFEPIHKAEAEKVRFINKYTKLVESLHLTKEESAAVQFVGEKQSAMLNNGKDLTAEEVKKEIDNYFLINKDLDRDKIINAVKVFRKIYDETFVRQNKVLISCGYAPVEYRKDYFPHFTDDGDETITKFFRAAGFDSPVTELPGDLTGKTENFKPGKPFFSHALQRKGNTTTFDAVEGFNRYIKGAADVILQTEHIRLLRALEESLRFKYSDKGVQKAIEKLRKDATLASYDKNSQIEDLLHTDLAKHNEFINWLVEYTNTVANKKSFLDRPLEKLSGRSRLYRFVSWWSKNSIVNMVLYNVSSALSNTVALQQAFSELNFRKFGRGMWDTLKNMKNNDGFADRSDFLTNRKGAFAAGKTKLQKFGEAANLMEHTDLFVCQAIVRARYYENMQVRKMSDAEALAEADNYAKSVIAGRAKGDVPIIFNATNLFVKSLTAFQLEVNNQLQNLFKDAPKRILDEKGIKGLASYIIKYLISAYLYNEFYEKITGRKIAIDPLGLVESCIESYTGIKIPNKLDMLTGDKITYGKKPEGVDKVFNVTKTAFTEATDQIPFIGSLLGGGRIPAAITVPDYTSLKSSIKNLTTGEGDVGKNVENLITDGVLPLAYGFLPFGGLNQINKTVKGISTVAKGEVVDNKGKLKYGVEQTPGNYIKGTIFGPSSLKDTRDFYDAGGKGLTDTEQKYYDKVTESGVSKYEAYQNVIGVRNAKNEISRKNTFYRIMSNDKFVGNVQLGADNAAYQEIMRLKKADTGISLDYTVPDNSFKVNGEDVFLTNAKYRKYASECSRSALDGIKTLIATDYYKKASDVEKAELIEEIYSYSKGISKTKVSKYEPESDVLKATLAKESKVSVGDYFTFKKQLPEKYNEADAYSLTQDLKMSEEQATMLTNLSKYSYDQCKRLQD